MKESQCQQIYGYLARGGSLTPLDALRMFGCNRLAARVHDLRREGFQITSKRIEVETRDGQLANVACYSMDGWGMVDAAS